MKYQLLVSAMNQTDFSLIDKMKIDSNTIIINQSDENKYESIIVNDNYIEMYTFNERGVGLSRNSAFMRANSEIIEFADDDMIFVSNYSKKVIQEFEMHPEADAILFSVESLNPDRPLHKIAKYKRVNRIESRKYGCARLAIRREKLIYNNISFSLLFGGGAKYGSGEDTLLIHDLIKAGLKVYISPLKIADVRQENSSWFKGYTDKYFFDKGALMYATYPFLCVLIAFVMAIKHSNLSYCMFKKIFFLYLDGIKDYRGRV